MKPRFRCYTCRRPSDTEDEHVGHHCWALRAWVVLQWRRLKHRLGLWDWAPKTDITSETLAIRRDVYAELWALKERVTALELQRDTLLDAFEMGSPNLRKRIEKLEKAK